jgi:hypothetical protein
MANTFEMDAAASASAIVTPTIIFGEMGVTSPTTNETTVMTASVKRAISSVIQVLRYDPVLRVRTEYYPRMDFAAGTGGVWEVDENQAYFRSLSEAASDELQVQHIPIRESGIAGADAIDLRIDYDGRFGTRSGSFAVATLKVEGTDFFPTYGLIDSATRKVCNDGIIRSEGTWPLQAGAVRLIYAAGYTPTELTGDDAVIDASAIYEAVIDESVRRFQRGMTRIKGTAGFKTPLLSENMGDYSYSQDSKVFGQVMSYGAAVMAETALKLEPFVNMGVLLGS